MLADMRRFLARCLIAVLWLVQVGTGAVGDIAVR